MLSSGLSNGKLKGRELSGIPQGGYCLFCILWFDERFSLCSEEAVEIGSDMMVFSKDMGLA